MPANDNTPKVPVTTALARALAGVVSGRIEGDGRVVFLPRSQADQGCSRRPALRLVASSDRKAWGPPGRNPEG